MSTQTTQQTTWNQVGSIRTVDVFTLVGAPMLHASIHRGRMDTQELAITVRVSSVKSSAPPVVLNS